MTYMHFVSSRNKRIRLPNMFIAVRCNARDAHCVYDRLILTNCSSVSYTTLILSVLRRVIAAVALDMPKVASVSINSSSAEGSSAPVLKRNQASKMA